MNSSADMAGASAERPGVPDLDEARHLLAPRYQVLELLGRGASAAVYKVLDRQAGGAARAVKLTNIDCAPEPEALRRSLCAEFLLASRLEHPNLVRCHELDFPPGSSTAATNMELVAGVPFGMAPTQGDPGLTCRLIIGLLRGLQMLHECGFVHADVKPSNVLCRVDGESTHAKLLDYHLTFRPELAERNRPRGTLRYMAPEAIGGEPVDGRADLYSAGVLMYEALTGRRLFEGSVGDIVTQHVTAAVAGLDEMGALARVVTRLLAKKPEGRYDSAAEAIRAIAGAAGLQEPPETQETLLARVRSAPCVGRDRILAAARAAFAPDSATVPHARAWLLSGPAGSGRSALTAEFRALAQAAGWRTLDLGAPDSADDLCRRLESVAPAREPAPPGAPPELEDVLTRMDLAFGRLFGGPGPRPFLLAVSNVDRTPEEAAGCLVALMTGAETRPVIFCLSTTPAGDLPPALQRTLDRWADRRSVDRLELPDLSDGERKELVARMLPAAVERGLVDRLARIVGGLPATIAALIEHLLSQGSLSMGPDGVLHAAPDLEHNAPPSLRALWQSALQALPPPCAGAVRLLSASKVPLPASLLAIATGTGEAELPDLLSGDVARHLVEVVGADEVVCRLRHEAIRGLCLEEIGAEGGPAELESRLADALATWPESRSHIWQARRVNWLAGAGRHAEAAAEAVDLAGRLGNADVQDEYAEALRQAAPHTAGAERRMLLEALADFYAARGRRAEGRDVLASLLAQPGLGVSDRLRLASKLAGVMVGLGDHAEGRELLQKELSATALLEEQPAELADVCMQLASCALADGPFTEAEGWLDRAREHARSTGRKDKLARASLALGRLRQHQGEYAAAAELLEAAQGLFEQVGDHVGVGQARVVSGSMQLLQGEWESCRQSLQESLRVFRAGGRPGDAADVLLRIAALSQRLTRWDEAVEQHSEALRLAEVSGNADLEASALVNLSQVKATVGWLEPAMDYARSALSAASGPTLRCLALNRLGRAQFALGLLDEAHASFTRNVSMAAEGGFTVLLETGQRMAAVVEMAGGLLEGAERRLRTALGLCRNGLGEVRLAVCLVRLVELLIAKGQVGPALEAAHEACVVAGSQKNQQVTGRALLGRARARLVAGETDAAIADLHDAHTAFAPAAIWDDVSEVEYYLGRAYGAAGQLRFASLYYRNALNTVELVARRLERKENYDAFLAAPPQAQLFGAVAELRATLALNDTQA